MQPSCADPSRRHCDTTRSAPSRSPRPAAASPSTMSGSCDQNRSACARRASSRASLHSLRVHSLAPSEERLVADEAPNGEHAENRGERGDRQRERQPAEHRQRTTFRCNETEPNPRAAPSSVRPTISQCQSRRAGGRPREECSEPGGDEALSSRTNTADERARAAPPPSKHDPDEAELCERLHVQRVTIADDLRDSGVPRTRGTRTCPHRFRRVAAPGPTSQPTRSCLLRPFPDTLKRRSFRVDASGDGLERLKRS